MWGKTKKLSLISILKKYRNMTEVSCCNRIKETKQKCHSTTKQYHWKELYLQNKSTLKDQISMLKNSFILNLLKRLRDLSNKKTINNKDQNLICQKLKRIVRIAFYKISLLKVFYNLRKQVHNHLDSINLKKTKKISLQSQETVAWN